MQVTFPHMGYLSIPLKSLFQNLGHNVITPPPVTKKTIELGVQYSPEFACLPLKINMGNFIEALEKGADTIVMGGGNGPCRFGYYAQVQREILKDLGYDFQMIVLEPPQKSINELINTLRSLGAGNNWREVIGALSLAWVKLKHLDELQKVLLETRAIEKEKGLADEIFTSIQRKIDQSENNRELEIITKAGIKELKGIRKDIYPEPLRIILLGEIYTLLEPYANLELEKILGDLGVVVERTIHLSDWIKEHLILNNFKINSGKRVQQAASKYLNHFVGGHGWESVGDTVLASRGGYDGVLHLLPFTCTPEIVAQSILPVVSRENNIPVMSLSLDEHSAKAGLVTRLEAFVDLLLASKKNNSFAKTF